MDVECSVTRTKTHDHEHDVPSEPENGVDPALSCDSVISVQRFVPLFQDGQNVEARTENSSNWIPCTILRYEGDGTYVIQFQNEKVSQNWPQHFLRRATSSNSVQRCAKIVFMTLIALALSPILILYGAGKATYLYMRRKLQLDQTQVYYTRNERNSKIVQDCSVLRENYYPPPYCVNAFSHMSFAAVLRPRPDCADPNVRGEYITLTSGRTVKLEWLVNRALHEPQDETPIVLVLPGFATDCFDGANLSGELAVMLGQRRPFQIAFWTRPGTGAPLSTAEIECTAYVRHNDLDDVLSVLDSRRPGAPKVILSLSFGTAIATAWSVLNRTGYARYNLRGVVMLGHGFTMVDGGEAADSWCCGSAGALMMGEIKDHITKHPDSCEALKRAEEEVEGFSYTRLMSAKSWKSWDSEAMRLYGYKDIDSMREYTESWWKYKDGIRFPTLIVNAFDDPICTATRIIQNRSSFGENAIIVGTPYGGHIGYWSHDKSPWLTRLVEQFFDSVLELPLLPMPAVLFPDASTTMPPDCAGETKQTPQAGYTEETATAAARVELAGMPVSL